MESEVLSEQMKWEAKRVAAAFGLKTWSRDVWFMHSTASLFSGMQGELEVSWRITPEGKAIHFCVGTGGMNDCIVTLRGMDLKISAEHFQQDYAELMARGLYGLGFGEEGVLSQLNSSLSAHEKMELRLAMPREFWPQTWMDGQSL